MADNAQIAYKYFQDNGLNKGAAAGVVGNLYVESGLNPHGPNGDGGIAKGLAQWHPDRWKNLQLRTAVGGGNPQNPSFADQLGFVVFEMKQRGQWDGLAKINDPRAAADYVDAKYEVSSGQSRTARENAAAQLYNTGDIKGASAKDNDIVQPGEIPGKIKDGIVNGWQGFAQDALVNAGIGILGVLAVIAGLVFVLMSTKTAKTVAGTAAAAV
jgi:hypothetical protein